MLNVRELVRRIRHSESDRRVARDLGVSRNTVAKYREWAAEEGFLEGTNLPDPKVFAERLSALEEASSRWVGPPSKAEACRELIEKKLKDGVELKALLKILKEEKGFTGSYSCLRRFVGKLKLSTPEAFVRVETARGEEAQVDFGYAGLVFDEKTGRKRKAWVFVMTLSYSRHQYTELVFDQKVETWVALHVRAFEWFGSVPRRLVIDNLRAAIVKAVVYDSEAQRSYRDLAEHYDFMISPCRPRKPQHKGKVESGVRYVKRNALAGREFRSLEEANRYLRRWIVEVAGVRIHGTTHEKPLDRFEKEKSALQPLPSTRYEVVVWKKAKAHSDCHVVFDYAYYSFPHRYVGEELWLRATKERLELYLAYERIVSHSRATRRGEWKTELKHYPPEKLEGLLPQPEVVRTQAGEIGPCTREFVERLLGERPMDRLRGAQGIVKLAKRHSLERVEKACARALAFDEISYHTVNSILRKGLDLEFLKAWEQGPLPKTAVFARPLSDIVSLRGGNHGK